MNSRKKVIVIGAGLSGLASANTLSPTFDVIILEASSTFGGRVKVLPDFAEVPLEAGGEEIHFNKTPFY